MHESSWLEMQRVIAERCRPEDNLIVADIGSMSVKAKGWQGRTYREHMQPNWKYHGLDIAEGRNVDTVMPSPDVIPLVNSWADVIISGQCLEHTKAPWVLIREMFRVLKHGGQIFLTAPAIWPWHRYPVDCWRFYPDGMAALLKWGGFDKIKTWSSNPDAVRNITGEWADCWGVGVKL